MPADGKYSVGYFVNWGIYGRKFPPSLIPVNDVTHLLYAFANVRGETGEVVLSDLWADQDIHYPGDSWNDVGTNLYGNFKAIYKLKKQNRALKLLLSIGGWGSAPAFHPVVVNPTRRALFVSSCIKLLEDYGLDGLDLDYEYPETDAQATGFANLLKELRTALNARAATKSPRPRFWLTAAVPCGPDNYTKLRVSEMDKSLDFWNLMSYDLAGSWDQVAGHQAALWGPGLTASAAVNWYLSKGIIRDKIVLGLPLYGRSFANTNGIGQAFNGVGPGTWEAGIYDYRALPLPGSTVSTDPGLGASWSYDRQKRELITYDNEEVGRIKGQYIKNERLGGSMFWELSGDKGSNRDGMETGPGKTPQPGNSLVRVVKDAMGPLEKSQNCLSYTGSKFDNMRKGMP